MVGGATCTACYEERQAHAGRILEPLFADGLAPTHCVPDSVMHWLGKQEKKRIVRTRAKARREEKRAAYVTEKRAVQV